MIVYKATNLINNKIYIGQTVLDLRTRKRQHENSHKYKNCYAFSRAIKKVGMLIEFVKVKEKLSQDIDLNIFNNVNTEPSLC